MPTCTLIADPWGVEQRLAELDLKSDNLREAVRAGLLERLACTDYDPVSARGYELWRMTSRRLREVQDFGPDPSWRALDERNQPLVVNPILGIAVTVSSGNDLTGNGDVNRPPSTRNPKGQVTADLVEANEQLLLFPGKSPFIRSPMPEERRTWILLVWASGSEARCELSLPKAISNGYIVKWHERLMLEPVVLNESPMEASFDYSSGGDDSIDVPVSRKRGA